ncbi:hypothetical protein V3C99_009091, partial [Haemonchus contortus]
PPGRQANASTVTSEMSRHFYEGFRRKGCCFFRPCCEPHRPNGSPSLKGERSTGPLWPATGTKEDQARLLEEFDDQRDDR